MDRAFSSRGLTRFGPEEIRAAVGPTAALESARRAFVALAEGRVVNPAPFGLRIDEVEGEVHVKGAWIRGSPVLALKVATGFYRNPEKGLPSGSGLLLVLDAATGLPLGLLEDGGHLTELRTGAAGALAAQHLASDPVDRLALVGAGTQARYQLRALARVRSILTASVWSRDPRHAERFAGELQEELGIELSVAPDVAVAVRNADLVVTVTPSRLPLVRSEWVADHATVIAVGPDGPGKQELDSALLARAGKIVVDDLEQCAGLGDLQHGLAAGLLDRGAVHATLGEVVSGVRAGREADELIVCDLTGVGAQDAAIAETAWRELQRQTG